MSITPEEIHNVKFGNARIRLGYDEDEVDNFLDEAERRVASGRPAILPGKFPQFTRTRFKHGYVIDQVDDFMERLAAEAGM